MKEKYNCQFLFILLILSVSASSCTSITTQFPIKIRGEGFDDFYEIFREGEPPIIYSGVRTDVAMIMMPIHEPEILAYWIPGFIMLFAVADLPLSFVSDTILLPWSIYRLPDD